VPNLTHYVKVPPDVVSGCQGGVQNLPGLEQMTKVSSGISLTSIALALGIDGPIVVTVAGVLDDDAPFGREQIPIPGVAGGQDAIHHIDAPRHVLGQLGRHPDPHGVTRPVARQNIACRFHHLQTEGPRLADREAADRVPIGVEVEEGSSAFTAKIRKHRPLDDRKERVAGGERGNAGAEMVVGLPCPADRASHGFPGVFVADGVLGALVEDHEDVAPEGELDVDGGFGGEGVGGAVKVGLKGDAAIGELAEVGKAEDLEAAGVGENGVAPGHEAMESAELANQFVAGPEEEVVGVCQDDLGVEVLEIALVEGFDGRLGADGHEHGGLDIAVGGVEDAGAGAGSGALGEEFEGDLAQIPV